MSNLATLQIKYACLIDELNEVKSRPSLLGTCKLWPALQSQVAEKSAKITLLEKASCETLQGECALCQGLILELEACHATKTRFEEENT